MNKEEKTVGTRIGEIFSYSLVAIIGGTLLAVVAAMGYRIIKYVWGF